MMCRLSEKMTAIWGGFLVFGFCQFVLSVVQNEISQIGKMQHFILKEKSTIIDADIVLFKCVFITTNLPELS